MPINAASTPMVRLFGQRSIPLMPGPDPIPPGAGFSVLSLMEPLLRAPAVIPQLIMSLCAVSIVTYDKLSEIMTPFHGGKKHNLGSMSPQEKQVLTGYLTLGQKSHA